MLTRTVISPCRWRAALKKRLLGRTTGSLVGLCILLTVPALAQTADNDYGAPVIAPPTGFERSQDFQFLTLPWEYRANHPEGVSRTAGVFDDMGRFHVVCGNCNSHISHPYDEIWDPRTNTWTRGAMHPSGSYGVHNHDVARLGNQIFVGGGNQGVSGFYNSLTVIDAGAGIWNVRTSMPLTSLRYYTFAAAGEAIYCLGGYNQLAVLNTNYRYDPGTNSWQARAPMPAARRNVAAAVVGDTIYVFGGMSANDEVSTTTTHWKYDWRTNRWSEGLPIPISLGWSRAVTVVHPDSGPMIYLLGGVSNGTIVNTVYRYSVRYARWDVETPLLTATRSHAAGARGNRIVVCGGYNAGILRATQEAYSSQADVQTLGIERPAGSIPHGMRVIPAARVRNNSDNPQTFPVRFTISDGYADTQMVTLAPGEQRLIDFEEWTASLPGFWITRCSTMLDGDIAPGNDRQTGTVTVEGRDVSVSSIDAPAGSIRQDTVVIPKATVRNNGTSAETFDVLFAIGNEYADTQNVTVPAGEELQIDFAQWTASTPGWLVTKCSTFTDDLNPANNRRYDSVFVRYPDVGTDAILNPTGEVDSGAVVVPQAVVHNYGNLTAGFTVLIRIGEHYQSRKPVTGLAPGATQTVDFDPWTAVERGMLPVRCSTELDGDLNSANDRRQDSVFVRVRDAATVAILSPSGVVDSGTTITPQARVRNPGNLPASFDVRFTIGSRYASIKPVTNLQPGADLELSFDDWLADEVGLLSVTCSTRLTGDMIPQNDRQTGTVQVLSGPVRDAGTVAILAPVGIIDSGTVVTPRARVSNFGTTATSFDVRFTIGTGYTSTRVVSNLAPGETTTVDFAPWTADEPGLFATKCTTMLAGDANPANDALTDSVRVRVVFTGDVGTVGIIVPTGALDSGTAVVPRARVHNFGPRSATFDVRMTIGTRYVSTRTVVELASGADEDVVFDDWLALERGALTVKCTTLLTGDINDTNDSRTAAVSVNVHDIGVTAILSPVGNIPPGVTVPSARLRNCGNVRDPVTVVMMIPEAGYSSQRDLPDGLPPEQDSVILFDDWNATQRGRYTAVCSTWSAPDQVSTNNVQLQDFSVGLGDVAVLQILAPAGVIDSAAEITPQSRLRNLGDLPASFPVFFTIRDSQGSIVYQDSQQVPELAGGQDTVITFALWHQPHPIGSYLSRCSTGLEGDVVPGNDTLSSRFTIVAVPPETGWVRKPDMPEGAKKKGVKDGAALAALTADRLHSTDIYAFKGNGRCEFYRYNIAGNVWETKESIPAVGSSGKKKAVKKGGTLCAGAGGLYGTKGNNTLEWWRYLPGDTNYPWQQMADIPAGQKAVKEGTGSAALTIADTTWIYFLKGSGTQEFYRYNTLTNTWQGCADAPLGPSGKAYKNGSALASDGNRTIYLVKGSYNEFYAYQADADSWTALAPVPFIGQSGKKKKLKEGAGLAVLAGTVYALKGGGTFEFWQYLADSNQWTQLADVPPGNGKKVKAGGALVAAENCLYALKGNNTLEFYSYIPVPGPADAVAGSSYASGQASRARAALRITPGLFSNTTAISYVLPSPGHVRIHLYDVTGRLRATLFEGPRPAGSHSIALSGRQLAAGIYLLKLTTADMVMTAKLIVE